MAENVIATGVVKLTSNAGGLGTGIASALQGLRPHLAAVKAEGESAAGGIGGSFSKAGGMVAAGMVIAGVAAIGFAIKSADTFKTVGTEVLKLQRYTGGTAQSMSGLRFAAQQSGVDTDKLAKSLGFLSKNLQSGKVDFSAYGIATLDAHGKSLPLDTVLFSIADKFKSMPNGAEKTAEAIKIFGKAGADLIPMLNKGGDGLRALEAEASKYGLILTGSNLAAIKANIAAHREQTAAMQGLQVQIGQNVLPVLTKLTTAFTEGLVKVMPVVTGIMNGVVVPAFSAFASVLSGTTSFIADHIGLIKVLGGVIGIALVPALIAWGVAQAVVLAENVASFILGIASAAVRGAASLGLMTGSLEAGSVAMTGTGIAAGGLLAILALLIAAYSRQGAAAQSAAAKSVAMFDTPQAKLADLLRQQKLVAQQFADKGDVGRMWFIRQFDGAYALKVQLTGINKEITAQKALIAAAGDATTQAGDAINSQFTTMGLKIGSLGGATKLTSDEVQQLADHLGIDLTKNSAAATSKLVDAATQLSYTSEATLRLSNDTEVLSTWTSTATDKTKAFKDALDALIGGTLSADQANIKYKQDIADLSAKLVAGKQTFDENTQAGRDNKTAIDNVAQAAISNADAIYKQTGSMDQSRASLTNFVADLARVLTAAGYTKDQISGLLAQLNLTPSAIAQVTPAVNDSAGALDHMAAAAANLIAQLDAAQNSVVGLANASAAAAAHGYSTGAIAAAAPSASPYKQPVRGAHAAGGFEEAGSPYLVGEEGPEIAIPRTNQDVLSHGQSKSVLSMMLAASRPVSTVVQNHYHILIPVAGSVVSEGELIEKVRVGINRYNTRTGAGR